jgi:ferredoxin
MTDTMTKGRISIDQDKCTGCGQCVEACHAGALAMVDGKACLVDENHCDGLGVCIGECPFGAISFGDPENNTVDKAVQEKSPEAPLACGCPGHMNQVFHKVQEKPVQKQAVPPTVSQAVTPTVAKSELGAWPIQLHLIRPSAAQFQGADLLIAASCSAFSHGGFHEEMLRGKALVIACPKLDLQDGYLEKLTELFRDASPASVTIVRMEVPCCQGLTQLVLRAKHAAESDIPVKETTIGLQGGVVEEVVHQ